MARKGVRLGKVEQAIVRAIEEREERRVRLGGEVFAVSARGARRVER
jgi:hypothetical protein